MINKLNFEMYITGMFGGAEFTRLEYLEPCKNDMTFIYEVE